MGGFMVENVGERSDPIAIVSLLVLAGAICARHVRRLDGFSA